ncbi:MAG: VWA domain-containing protein [Acidobacteriota bacterium]
MKKNRLQTTQPAGALAALALTALLTATTASAQDSSPRAEFGDLVEVSEVLLDVLVTDRDGNVVIGLGPEDFVIEEDDQTRNVTGVSFYSNRFQLREGEKGVQNPLSNEVPADRYFILFFHDQRRQFDPRSRLVRKQLEASRQAKRWVQEEMLQGDWVAVASYDVKLKVQSDFTQDRAKLVEAIESASKSKDPGNQWASRRPAAEEDKPSLLAHLPSGDQLRDESKNIYDGISLVAEATRDILGRKNLLMFTTGFGEVRRTAGTGGFLQGAFMARPDERFYPELEQSLNDNNVAVYPIDLTPNEFEHVQRDFLTQLAGDSGGRYHFNFTSFILPMRQVADEVNGYYLLGYQAEHPSGERGYREVKVTTRNPEFRVRARQGYRFGA